MRDTEVKVTHYGKWIIDEKEEISIDCYVTNDNRRMLSLRGTARAMGLKGGGSGALVRNLNSKWIEPYLSIQLEWWLEEIQNNQIEKVKGIRGEKFYPFDAELFVDLCNAYIKANKDGVFNESGIYRNQKYIADKLLIIMSAFAKVGIVALIDEVTGFQEQRDKDELQKILSMYVSKEFQPWALRFPNEYYEELYRLRGWKESKGKNKNQYVGKLTNQIVYNALPENVLDELRVKNPIVENKNYRRRRHHQYLTKDLGIQHLDKQITSVIALMKASNNWNEFEVLFNRAFKKI
jgi:hypothetical protein